MKKTSPKTTNSLMKYMRDEKGISISGSSQKKTIIKHRLLSWL